MTDTVTLAGRSGWLAVGRVAAKEEEEEGGERKRASLTPGGSGGGRGDDTEGEEKRCRLVLLLWAAILSMRSRLVCRVNEVGIVKQGVR